MYIRLNIEIADEYIFNNPDTSEFYTRRALERAERLNDVAAMAKTENFLGIRDRKIFIKTLAIEAVL